MEKKPPTQPMETVEEARKRLDEAVEAERKAKEKAEQERLAKPATKQDLENAVRYMDGRIDVMGALKIMEQKEVEINSLERKEIKEALFVLLERKGNELNMAVFLLCVSVAFFIASIVIRLTS